MDNSVRKADFSNLVRSLHCLLGPSLAWLMSSLFFCFSASYTHHSMKSTITSVTSVRSIVCVNEKLDATMEDALSLAFIPSRRNKFLKYILETRPPGVHFNLDDDVGSCNATTSPQCYDPRIPGYLQNLEGWGSDKPAMKIPAEGLKGGSSRSEEENFGEPAAAAAAAAVKGLSHSHCLEFLARNGPNFLMKNLNDKESICIMLLEMAENVKVLPPGNEPLPWDILSMSLWRDSLCELVKEMKTVEGNCCASLIGDSGVYVLTASPYSAFLRALAMEIADRSC